jgi:hypothetical protein
LIREGRVHKARILSADGHIQIILQSVKEDVVSQNMAIQGHEEGDAAGFEAFEQIRPAEAHEPLPGTAKVLDDTGIVV